MTKEQRIYTLREMIDDIRNYNTPKVVIRGFNQTTKVTKNYIKNLDKLEILQAQLKEETKKIDEE